MRLEVEDFSSSCSETRLILKSNGQIRSAIKKELQKVSAIIGAYYFFIMSFLGGLVFSQFEEYFNFRDFSSVILQTSFGILLGVICIPFHEMIHGLLYKCVGAPNVKFNFTLKPLAFYTSASRFVLSMREYVCILLFPFVLISLGGFFCLYGFEFSNVIVFSTLFVHTLLCSGDFALVSLSWRLSNGESYTYYDSDLEQLYFLSKK